MSYDFLLLCSDSHGKIWTTILVLFIKNAARKRKQFFSTKQESLKRPNERWRVGCGTLVMLGNVRQSQGWPKPFQYLKSHLAIKNYHSSSSYSTLSKLTFFNWQYISFDLCPFGLCPYGLFSFDLLSFNNFSFNITLFDLSHLALLHFTFTSFDFTTTKDLHLDNISLQAYWDFVI